MQVEHFGSMLREPAYMELLYFPNGDQLLLYAVRRHSPMTHIALLLALPHVNSGPSCLRWDWDKHRLWDTLTRVPCGSDQMLFALRGSAESLAIKAIRRGKLTPFRH